VLLSIDILTGSEHTDTPLESSIPALDSIRKAGKTKYIGLSECSAKTLRKANSSTWTHRS
jgi:aryl-alcohol dehydrogenase-like predicted oxidoreductase